MNLLRSLKFIILLCYVIFMLLVLFNDVHADTENDLYLKAFGIKQQTRTQLLSVPLLIDNRLRGDVQILLNGKEDKVEIKFDDLLLNIEPILKPKVVEAIKIDLSNKENITLAELARHQLDAHYDIKLLELHLSIPATLKMTEVISFRTDHRIRSDNNLLKPEKFSAYVNLFSELQYVWKGDSHGRQPANIVFDSAFNYDDWVFEGEAFYREGNLKPFQRGKIRVVRDLVSHSLRIAAIDVSLPTTDFQRPMAVGGLVIAKNFQLRPDLITYPASQKQFLLEHPSTVEILLNSKLYRTLHLPAGNYDLRDFPVARGVNDIVIRIKDDFGRKHELAFPFFSETTLLAKNLHEYAVGLGFPSTISKGEYDTRRLFLSGFHRFGLHDNMTIGINAQGNKEQQLLGSELSLISRLGHFSVRSAVSRDEEENYGFASSLNYSYQAPINSKHRSRVWDFSAIYKTSEFSPPGQIPGTIPLTLDVTGEVSQPLGNDMFLSLRGNYQQAYTGNSSANNVSVLFRKNISRQLNWNLALTRADDFNRSTDYQISANISYTFGGNNQSVRSSYNSKDQSKRFSWEKRSDKTYGGYGFGVDVIKKRYDTVLTGHLQHRNNRIEASLRHDMEWPQNENLTPTKRTSLSVATALTYADGHVGLSRPIRDSFAIVVPHSSIKNQKIGVNPSTNSYQTESGSLGPAVIPDLISYQSSTLTIEAPELPPGYNLDNNLPTLLPTYRSGTLIPLGGDENVLLVGVLYIRESETANLETGKLISLDDSKDKERPFFTNRKGKFYIDRLKPGRYQLHLFSYPKDKLTIEVPVDAAGIYDIGKIGIQ